MPVSIRDDRSLTLAAEIVGSGNELKFRCHRFDLEGRFDHSGNQALYLILAKAFAISVEKLVSIRVFEALNEVELRNGATRDEMDRLA